jgi:hypothetical protein
LIFDVICLNIIIIVKLYTATGMLTMGDGGVGKSGKEIKQKGTKVEKFIFPTTVDLSVLRVTIHYRLMNHVYVVKGI